MCKLILGRYIQLPDYDDKTKTIHLSKLNKDLLTQLDRKEFQKNNLFFQDIKADNKQEKMILKAAKDLRICLKFFNE